MCTPALLLASLTVATTAVASTVGYVGQVQQAKAQTQMATSNAQSAANSFRLQQAQLQNQLIQQRTQVEQQDTAQTIDAARLQATQRVSAAEAGVSGVSLDAIQGQATREAATQSAINQRNYSTMQQDEQNKEGQAYFEMENRVNSVPGGIFPSLATPILNTAGSALNAYGTYIYKPK